MIYLAPVQGFTDFIYRKAYNTVFSGVDIYTIPYISLKDNEIINKYKAEIIPENNPQKKVIPQVLVKNEKEIVTLSHRLKDLGYHEINLNLGCPYPMATNRKKGSGLLPFPGDVQNILKTFFEKSDLKLSVKLRLGLTEPSEIEQIIPILNQFPLTEIIVHPRIAKQLYKGEINNSGFGFAQKYSQHKTIYNGDIFSLIDFQQKQQMFPETKDWMLGRGILMNPFLPTEIFGINYSIHEKKEKLCEFHQLILEGYKQKMDNQGNVLNKMKQFWSYFSFAFPNQKKVFKRIKKTSSTNRYLTEIQTILKEYDN